MRSLLARTAVGFLALALVMGLVIFGGAGDLAYWQGWLLVAVFFGACSLITIWLWRHDRSLLDRRTRSGPGSERDPVQKLVQTFAYASFLAILLIPALDHRFGWSRVPLAAVLAGEAMVAAGFWVVFLTFRENSYAAAVIEVTAGQKVIETGPYARLRHPMYAGALVMLVGVPLALGSWWGLLAAASMVPMLVWRLKREERLLAEQLAGYGAYMRRVRYRLAPGLW